MRSLVAAESLSGFEDSRAQWTLMNLIPNQFSLLFPLKRIPDPLGMAGFVAPQSLRRFEHLLAFLASVDFSTRTIGIPPPHISRQHHQAQGDIPLFFFFFHLEIDPSQPLESRAVFGFGFVSAAGAAAAALGVVGVVLGGEREDSVVGTHVSAQGFAVWESLETELAIHGGGGGDAAYQLII